MLTILYVYLVWSNFDFLFDFVIGLADDSTLALILTVNIGIPVIFAGMGVVTFCLDRYLFKTILRGAMGK